MSNQTEQQNTVLDGKALMKVSSELSEMSIEFMLRWKIANRVFMKAQNANNHMILAKKDINLPKIENLIFELQLTFDSECRYQVEIHHDFQDKCKFYEDLCLKYAFVTMGDHTFSLGPSNNFPFEVQSLTIFNLMASSAFNSNDSKTITIHCGIIARTNVKLSSSENSDLEEHNFHNVLSPCMGHNDNMDTGCKALYAKDEESTIISKYRFSGEIPELNAEKAMKLYQRCRNSLSRFSEITAICLEYLLYNLTSDNVIGVLMFAHKNELEELSTKCIEFLSRKCTILNLQ